MEWRTGLAAPVLIATIGAGTALIGAELGPDGQPSLAAFVAGCFTLAAVSLAYLVFGQARKA